MADVKLRFGYVEFEEISSAGAAVKALNQEVFQGRRMAVQYHRRREPISLTQPRQPNEPSKTLFIGNMSFEMSDKDLNDLFREVRNVIDVRVAIDRRTGQPRGFAHADFIDIDSAIKARNFLQEKEIYGRKLRVDFSASSTQNRGAI
jgi:nucleolin